MKNLRWMLALAAVAAMAIGCGEEDTKTTTATDTASGDAMAADMAGDATTTVAPKGCTADGDKTFLGTLADETKLKEFKATLSSCTLTKGCLGKANATAKITCIADCMDTAYTAAGLTKACSACYGLTGWCAAGPCLANCIDSASAACGECVAKNCDPYTNACKAGTCDPYDASNCGATK